MPSILPDWLEDFRARLGAEVIETHISWLLLTAVVVLLSYRLIEQRALRLKARVAAAASTPAEPPAS